MQSGVLQEEPDIGGGPCLNLIGCNVLFVMLVWSISIMQVGLVFFFCWDETIMFNTRRFEKLV